MFVDELEIFAAACATGSLAELTANDGVVALAVVNAALRSIERKGQAVPLNEILQESRDKVAAEGQHAAE